MESDGNSGPSNGLSLGAAIPSLSDEGRLPTSLIWLFAALCIAPELLRLAGVNFGFPTPHIDAQHLTRFTRQAQLIDQFHAFLEGSSLHNLLEWTGVCVALGAAVLAFIHFRLTGSVLAPVIGGALTWSGLFDAFHTLASDHLLRRVADLDQFIPFTWAAARLFNWAVLVVGGIAVLLHKKPRSHAAGSLILKVLVGFAVCFGGSIWFCTSHRLAQTRFPEAAVPRPYDLGWQRSTWWWHCRYFGFSIKPMGRSFRTL